MTQRAGNAGRNHRTVAGIVWQCLSRLLWNPRAVAGPEPGRQSPVALWSLSFAGFGSPFGQAPNGYGWYSVLKLRY